MSIWKYADILPPVAAEHRISLGEGQTPLIRSGRIGPAAGLKNLYFKLEGSNPTGSYKDRFTAFAVSHLLAAGKNAVVGVSSGNAGAALAAYSAAVGISCYVAILEKAAEGKLRQMLAYGATLLRIRGLGFDPVVTDEIVEGLGPLAAEMGAAQEISAFRYCPLAMEAVQTISYELAEQLPADPDHVFSPTAGGGLSLAVARGFARAGCSTAVHCVQPEGNNTIAGPLRQGGDRAQTSEGATAISALQIANVIDGDEALAACRASGGTGYLVSDEEVFSAQARMAREEGIFSEPAGAIALAGVLDAYARRELDRDAVVVCLVTGTGFKDDAAIERMVDGQSCPLVDSLDEFRQACLDPGR